MPDHPRGYVHRQHGLQASDLHIAAHYRFRQKSAAVLFGNAAQRLMIETAREAGPHIDATVHGVAVEPTHIHVLVSWQHARTWESMRASIRSALSRALNHEFGNRGREGWFSDSPSRKRVRDHEHFDYLLLEYLPDHGRWWISDKDGLAAQSRDAGRATSVRKRKKRREGATRHKQ
jgi:REP element-mobilizing transposase RayT